MSKILGLDLGSGSIGWAILKKSGKEDKSIVDAGVRIVPLNADESKEFQAGQAISTNAARRDKRSARRNNQRFKLRRDRLVGILKENHFFDKISDVQFYEQHKIWDLRSKAVSNKIKLNELAAVFLHINGKRGYQSNRKTDGGELTAYLEAISDRDQELVDKNLTIGELINEKLKENNYAYTGEVYTRQAYKTEFDKIWEQQQKHYPFLTDNLKKQIADYTIFYQRTLKSQKGRVSKCVFENQRRVTPKSNPLFQEFRLLQKINNLALEDTSTKKPLEITERQKESIYLLAQQKDSLSDKQILKCCMHNTKSAALNIEKLEGNRTLFKLNKAFEEAEIDTLEILNFDWNIKGNAFDKQPYMQLWHILYATENRVDVIKKLQTTFGFTEMQAEIVADVKLESDYGSLSSKAIRKIVPHLNKGLNYYEAAVKAGYNPSNAKTDEEIEALILDDKIKLPENYDLRSPVVEKVIRQLVNLVNALIEEYGAFDAIHIELTRELKQSQKQRKRSDKQNRDNQKENLRIKSILKGEKAYEDKKTVTVSKNPSMQDVLKYKLWEETGGISIYTGKTISPVKVFTTNEYDVEHIIPRARLFDDSFLNKTLSERAFNEAKGKQTAFDYIATLGDKALNEFIVRVQNSKLPEPKKRKLLMAAKDIPDDFIERQKKETQYISKEVKSLLHQVSKDIVVTTGAITSHLRNIWGLEEVMKQINWDKFPEDEKRIITRKNGDKIYKIKNWSKRLDHRHHAIDAIVIACTTKSYIQRMNTLNAQFEQDDAFKARYKPAMPWQNFRHDVKQCLEEILISRKKKNKVLTQTKRKVKINGKLKTVQNTLTPRGALHKETVFKKIKVPAAKKLELSKVKTENEFNLIQHPVIKALVLERYSQFNGVKEFKKDLKKNPILYKEHELSEVSVFEETYAVRKPLSQITKPDKIVDPIIRQAWIERLKKYGNKDKAVNSLTQDPFTPKNNAHSIKRVLIAEPVKDLVALHEDENGNPIDFVATGNNHHISVFEDEKGKGHFIITSFYEAVERAIQNKQVYVTEHPEGYTFIMTLEANDYFVFKEPEEELSSFSKKEISQRLFRVQKISMSGNSPNLMFRNHLESTLNSENEFSFKNIRSYGKLKGEKIRINNLGMVKA